MSREVLYGKCNIWEFVKLMLLLIMYRIDCLLSKEYFSVEHS